MRRSWGRDRRGLVLVCGDGDGMGGCGETVERCMLLEWKRGRSFEGTLGIRWVLFLLR